MIKKLSLSLLALLLIGGLGIGMQQAHAQASSCSLTNVTRNEPQFQFTMNCAGDPSIDFVGIPDCMTGSTIANISPADGSTYMTNSNATTWNVDHNGSSLVFNWASGSLTGDHVFDITYSGGTLNTNNIWFTMFSISPLETIQESVPCGTPTVVTLQSANGESSVAQPLWVVSAFAALVVLTTLFIGKQNYARHNDFRA